MDQNKKVNAAIVFWAKKFKRENIPFGILKIQKFLWYAQILSWDKYKKFIFKNLKFQAWRYGPLNVDSWKEWRTFLNPDNQENNIDWEKKLNQKNNFNKWTSDEQQILNLIFEKKKNTNGWGLAIETHFHKPYIDARRKGGASEETAKSFEKLKIEEIDNKNIQKASQKIVQTYIYENE